MNSDTVSIIVEFGGFELFETFTLINKTFYKEINAYYQNVLTESPETYLVEAAFDTGCIIVIKKILANKDNVEKISYHLLSAIIIRYICLHNVSVVKMLFTVLGKAKISFLAQSSRHLRLNIHRLIENPTDSEGDSAAWMVPFFDESVVSNFITVFSRCSDVKALTAIETSCNFKFDVQTCAEMIRTRDSGTESIIFFLKRLLEQQPDTNFVRSVILDLYACNTVDYDTVIEYIEENVDESLRPSAEEAAHIKEQRINAQKLLAGYAEHMINVKNMKK